MKLEGLLQVYKQRQDQMLLDDIIDIYKGKFKSYREYLDKKEKQILEAFEENKTKQIVEFKVTPLCLSEALYEYLTNMERIKLLYSQIQIKYGLDTIRVRRRNGIFY